MNLTRFRRAYETMGSQWDAFTEALRTRQLANFTDVLNPHSFVVVHDGKEYTAYGNDGKTNIAAIHPANTKVRVPPVAGTHASANRNVHVLYAGMNNTLISTEEIKPIYSQAYGLDVFLLKGTHVESIPTGLVQIVQPHDMLRELDSLRDYEHAARTVREQNQPELLRRYNSIRVA